MRMYPFCGCESEKFGVMVKEAATSLVETSASRTRNTFEATDQALVEAHVNILKINASCTSLMALLGGGGSEEGGGRREKRGGSNPKHAHSITININITNTITITISIIITISIAITIIITRREEGGGRTNGVSMVLACA